MATIRTPEGKVRTRPVVDGSVLPDTARAIFESGRQNRVPVIVGWNADEGSLPVRNAPEEVDAYRTWARRTYGDATDAFLRVYEATTPETSTAAFLKAYGDQNFGWEMRQWARLTQTAGQPAYLYHFTRVPPGSPTGVYHAAEIRYVFDNLRVPGGRHAYTEVDARVSELMASYWVSFAATGDPNADGLRAWPAYTADGDQLMEFGDTAEVRHGFRKAELDYFDRRYAER